MRKLLILLIVAVVFSSLGCGGAGSRTKPAVIKVGASVIPHAEILDFIKPMLAKDGINLQVVENHVNPNRALADKELDANYFQHIPYLDKFSADHKLSLSVIAHVHIEPMGIYSRKIKAIAELPVRAIVSIPNDPTNGGRALLLLDKAGVIKLKSDAGITAKIADITENPKRIIIRELETAQLPRSFEDVTLAVINTNYALGAKLVPSKDALFIESADSPYVNVLVVRKGDENRAELKKLAAALNSPEVKKFIGDRYKGAIVPAF